MVVGAVIVANLPALTGLVDVNPLGPLGHTASHLGPRLLPGTFYLDPEIGWTSQALGHLAATDWLHGSVPWWNPFEGLGAPLAAEMQSAAFFPPTLLLALDHGQLYFSVVLEAAAGIGTYLLVRELGLARPVAALGGVLFALNGTFAWFGSASVNPVCLLPFALLGVERLFRRPAPDPGWLILAAALALSVYAGFPETAYLDGLLVAAWAAARLVSAPRSKRGAFSVQLLLGVVAGGLLAAPLLVPFLEYLPHAYLGLHSLVSFSSAALPPSDLRLVGLPYLFGPIMGFLPHSEPAKATVLLLWAHSGGFVTASAVTASMVGLLGGRRDLALRVTLAATTVIMVLWTFGLPAVQVPLDHILPLITHVKVFRYDEPDWAMALSVLACFGVDAARHPGGRRRMGWAAVGGGLLGLALLGAELGLARPVVSALAASAPGYRDYAVATVAWGAGMVVATALSLWLLARCGAKTPSRGRGRLRLAAATAGGLLALDAVAMFVVPQLSAPSHERLDLGPARYLARHLGNGRFFSLDRYLPDYGGYFGLASADSNDVPLPSLWSTYVAAHLSSNTEANYFGTHTKPGSLSPTQGQELLSRLRAYEAIDVRYVLLPAPDRLFGTPGHLARGVRLVYRDGFAALYALSHPRPYFSTTGGACRLRSSGGDVVTASCPAATTLVRNELFASGWTATVRGRHAPIRLADGALEAVRLPEGTSTVRFSYEPPGLWLGVALFAAGGVAAAAGLVAGRKLRRSAASRHVAARGATAEPAGPDGG